MINRSQWSAYWQLMRADKPIGIYLLLWPTVWALLLAGDGTPPLSILLIFVFGVIVMRSAGCVINDIADRNIDGSVERTAKRPLATGAVTLRQAQGLFLGLLLVAFMLVLMLNFETVLLSLGALILASVYPFTKRYTHFPQVVLGAAFSWSIPMAAMAILGTLPFWVWWLYLANLLWTVAYDTQYAMVDREDDIVIGVKSTAVLFGQYDRLIISTLHMATLGIWIWLGNALAMSWVYFAALGVCAALFVQQQWSIRRRDRDACFKAFLNNHYVGMVIAAGIGFSYWL